MLFFFPREKVIKAPSPLVPCRACRGSGHSLFIHSQASSDLDGCTGFPGVGAASDAPDSPAGGRCCAAAPAPRAVRSVARTLLGAVSPASWARAPEPCRCFPCVPRLQVWKRRAALQGAPGRSREVLPLGGEVQFFERAGRLSQIYICLQKPADIPPGHRAGATGKPRQRDGDHF